MQPKFLLFFFLRKADMSTLNHFSESSIGCQSKRGYFSRQPSLLSVFLHGTLPSCHPVILCLCTHHLVLSVPERMKKILSVQDSNSRALVTGRSVYCLPLSGTTFLPTSDTAVPSHSSKLHLKPFSPLLPSPSYLNPLKDLFLLVNCRRLSW